MLEDASDEALMLAYRDGDARAFEVLYARFRGRLYRYLRHQMGNTAQAEELFQDVWLKVIRARKGYEVAAKFSTWLFRIAHNRLIDHYRSQSHSHLVAYDDDRSLDDAVEALPDPPYERPDMRLERKQAVERLARALAALPAPQREAFLLSQEADLSVEAIASATGVNRETAKSRLRYALNRLRAGLREEA